jgi:hypothetical protein
VKNRGKHKKNVESCFHINEIDVIILNEFLSFDKEKKKFMGVQK